MSKEAAFKEFLDSRWIRLVDKKLENQLKDAFVSGVESKENKRMKVLDLFSGIGGFSLGLEREGFETVAFVERDKRAQMILRKHWKDTPIFNDIKLLDRESVGKVDLICGGFPCQPFSSASRGQKVAEDLWPEMARIIWQFMPRWVVAENVLPAPIEQAKRDLELLGYKCEYRNIGAHDCGADHKRNRWWLVAHSDNQSEFSSALDDEVAELPKLCEGVWGSENYARAVRVPYGLPHRMDRFRMLGNTVVPYIPQVIGRAIMKVECNSSGS